MYEPATQQIRKISCATIAAVFVISIVTSRPAFAQTETALYNFCSLAKCADGNQPQAGLITDANGNFYGTTVFGGAQNEGTVFKISAEGTETVLHSFGAFQGDGANPQYVQLLMDGKGNLYGTTANGGAFNAGTVFKITPANEEKVLYSFCSTGGSACSDGSTPVSSLIADKQGNLYGTTLNGGTNNYGVVFKVSPKGTETVLYRFSGTDGKYPEAGLVVDTSGNFYGTTYSGGDLNFCKGLGCGVVFKLTASGTETVLHSFCSANTGCKDGSNPYAGLILEKGNLFGTTWLGGTHNCGTVYRVNPNGKETVVHSFTCVYPDGQSPVGPVTMDGAGNLYGTTPSGGMYDTGIVYEISPAGAETVLYNFGKDQGAAMSGLLLNSSGSLYGTSAVGGTGLGGTVFEVTP